MSNQPNDPNAGEESLDDLEVPADESGAVTGGITFKSSDDEDTDSSHHG